ncbi:MAG TPA: DUF6498-containing protein [Candidatus Limnocylindrales bacterium]|nr:DUF6498-containing protein [Candidatus Limnocylindrales bacterium]
MTSATGTDRVGRFFDLYRETATSRTAIALVVANAIPLIGVVLFGWSLWTILVLYWVENGIVGFWTVPKILLAQGSPFGGLVGLASSRFGQLGDGRPAALGLAAAEVAAGAAGTVLNGWLRVPLTLFFLVHYGLFWLVHGIFVFGLPTFPALAGGDNEFGEIVWSSVAIGAVAMFISHGASFLFTYLGRGEYLRTSAVAQMAAPYGRVVVLHLTILFGAYLAALIGAPIGALIILVVLKTLLDLRIHLATHRPALTPQPA